MQNYTYALVQYKENLKQNLSIGEYPSFNMDNSIPLAVVGEDIYDKAIIREDERYITIQGIEYKIVGVLKKSAPDYIDYTVIVFMDSLSEKIKKDYIKDNFESGWFTCNYHSDKYDYSNNLNDLYYEYDEKGWDVSVSKKSMRMLSIQ